MLISVAIGVVSEEVFSGNILTIIALNFGAREWQIGLLGFLIAGASISQIFVIGLQEQSQKKKRALLLRKGLN